MALLPHARELHEHEHPREGQRRRDIQEPGTIAAEPAGLGRVRDAAHDGVVDGVPDPGADKHEHDEQGAQVQDVRVILLQQGGDQAEDEAARRVHQAVADVVLGLKSAGPGDVLRSLFHRSIPPKRSFFPVYHRVF